MKRFLGGVGTKTAGERRKCSILVANSLSTKHNRREQQMKMRTLILTGAMIVASSLSAHAQPSFSITSSVIGSGGGPAAGGSFVLDGTIGQAVVGPVTGGSFTDNQGFWYTAGSSLGVTQIA